MASEHSIQQRIMLAMSRLGAKIFRINTGTGWVGTLVDKTPKSITLNNPRILHAGMCKGGSDLVGILPVTITPDMVSQKIGVFIAIEVKAEKGRATADQLAFIKMVNDTGGIGFIARSEDDAKKIVDSYLTCGKI